MIKLNRPIKEGISYMETRMPLLQKPLMLNQIQKQDKCYSICKINPTKSCVKSVTYFGKKYKKIQLTKTTQAYG